VQPLGHHSEPVFEVSHCLRIRAQAESSAIALATTLREPEVIAVLDDLRSRSFVDHRDGRSSGWRLTESGQKNHANLLSLELTHADCREGVERAYGRFVSYNSKVKSLFTDWQIRVVQQSVVTNDHTDTDYDSSIIQALGEVHIETKRFIEDLTATLGRFKSYSRRFDAAWKRLCSGDRTAMAHPLSESYHDIWAELHMDLLLLLGRERSRVDGY